MNRIAVFVHLATIHGVLLEVTVLFWHNGFHPPLPDNSPWRIPETNPVPGRAEADSSKRVSGSVGQGSEKPGPVTLPDIPADDRPPELPAASPPVYARLPTATFYQKAKVNAVSGISCATFAHFPRVNSENMPFAIKRELPIP